MPNDNHKRLQNLFSWKQLYQWQFNKVKSDLIQEEIDSLQKIIDINENFTSGKKGKHN
tara:strand:- start:508 stop:681 length:174 start_codon:yes stop_codon:yes gene_type:complete